VTKEIKHNSAHPDERTLELFALRSDLLSDRREEIAIHVKECAGCSALVSEIGEYYAEATRLQSAQQYESAHALYAPDRSIRPRWYSQTADVAPRPASVPQRVARSLRAYPGRWSSGALALIAAAVLLLPAVFKGDDNLAYVRAKDEFIVAYNASGTELWRRHVGEGYDVKNFPDWVGWRPERGLTTCDVDADGRPEVVAVFGWTNLKNPTDKLDNRVLCLNGDGTEKWHYDVHRTVRIGGVEFSDNFKNLFLLAGDFDRDGDFDILVGATHEPWYPFVIVRLRGSDGSFVSEYWHNGATPYVVREDLDGDGLEELLLAGQNNRLGMACLLVLDPRSIEGSGPAPKGFELEGALPGKEKFYLLFPQTDLIARASDITNRAFNINVRANGQIEMIVMEPLDDHRAEVYYYLERDMKCVRVGVSDHFAAVHQRLEREGVLKRPVDSKYLEEVRTGIKYWDGSRFVKRAVPVQHPDKTAQK
jgi:hypothetical protein